ncbi:MAG: PilZ domain-containing protein [Candidatus Omnitrophota bacterium]
MSDVAFGYRRAYKRLLCFLKGTCIASDGKVHEVSCNDISYKGAGLLCNNPLAINSHLKLKLSSTKMDLLEIEGKVCWNNNIRGKWKAGVLFDRILPFSLEKVV